jgi:hypothetical protein
MISSFVFPFGRYFPAAYIQGPFITMPWREMMARLIDNTQFPFLWIDSEALFCSGRAEHPKPLFAIM